MGSLSKEDVAAAIQKMAQGAAAEGRPSRQQQPQPGLLEALKNFVAPTHKIETAECQNSEISCQKVPHAKARSGKEI